MFSSGASTVNPSGKKNAGPTSEKLSVLSVSNVPVPVLSPPPKGPARPFKTNVIDKGLRQSCMTEGRRLLESTRLLDASPKSFVTPTVGSKTRVSEDRSKGKFSIPFSFTDAKMPAPLPRANGTAEFMLEKRTPSKTAFKPTLIRKSCVPAFCCVGRI